MSVLNPGGAFLKAQFGFKVTKATGVVINGEDPLFTIAGGKVLVTGILGFVTVVIGSTVSNLKLVFDPTATGADFDLCTATAITSDAVEQQYTIAGTVESVGALLVAGAVGQCNPFFTDPLSLTPGQIHQNLSADPVGGEITWNLWYLPLDDGASVSAAA
ncbi:MAG TPA: hypothetical protein VFC00_02640 [Micromonosporaceae bacterium]|nr:hypothetical protein [Micromonosporaceae bacterium]